MMSKGNPVFYGRDKSRKSKVAAGILKIIFRCVGTRLKEKASTIRRRHIIAGWKKYFNQLL